jgi:hypothetical protein
LARCACRRMLVVKSVIVAIPTVVQSVPGFVLGFLRKLRHT